ncbi:MAG: DUF4198 domain-containing protein [Planctomycetes bacterium]|nr:DUF4198 domain-containing protein [Planctomycetota bacterium]
MHYVLAAWVLAVVLSGCGTKPNVVTVSGIVLLDGKPMVGASINTQPIATSSKVNPGSGSFGKTDNEGRYTLELVDPSMQGAWVGEHRVTITQASEVGYKSSDEMTISDGPPWPTRYGDGSLRLTVPPEGMDSANFDLTLK